MSALFHRTRTETLIGVGVAGAPESCGLPGYALGVNGEALAGARRLISVSLKVRGAAGEQQDKEITHFSSPLVNDQGSIYFLPEIGFGKAWEKFP